jgi:hypothetical protein
MKYNDHFNLLLAIASQLVIINPKENTIFISMIKATICICFLRIYLLDFMLMEDIVGVFLR